RAAGDNVSCVSLQRTLVRSDPAAALFRARRNPAPPGATSMCMGLLRSVTVLVLLTTGGAAQAVCVENGDDLFKALKAWAASDPGTLTQIKLAQGTYGINVDLSQGQDYEGGELQLLGGYSLGDSCATRSIDPFNTILDGNGSDFRLQANGPVTFDGITMRNYSGTNGIDVWGYTGDASITMRRFIAQNDTTLALDTPVGVRLENCIVFGRQSDPGFAAFQVDSDSATILTNCTIADNKGDGLQ